MKLNREEVIKIAKLARLELSEAEIAKLQKELSAILVYVSQLQKLDTKAVKPTSQVTGLANIKRKDEVSYNFTRAEILASALAQEEDHLKVKNVF